MTHAEAREIVRAAWKRVHGREPSENEIAYTQAIALLETGYGRSGQFGALAARGQYNWGALERGRSADGTCPAGTAAGSDQGRVCFYVFPDDVSAATAFIKNLTTRHWPTVQAMQGSAEDVARAMRVPPVYYVGLSGSEEDRIRAYANAITNALHQIGAAPKAQASMSVSKMPWLLLAGAGAAFLYGHTYGYPSWVPRFFRI